MAENGPSKELVGGHDEISRVSPGTPHCAHLTVNHYVLWARWLQHAANEFQLSSENRCKILFNVRFI